MKVKQNNIVFIKKQSRNMPCGIDYEQIKIRFLLVVKPARAVLFIWSLEFIWALKFAALWPPD